MKVFPVIHINNTEAAVAQAETALDLQADGVYLIDHAGRSDRVFETLDTLRTQRPESYIGVNLLGHTALEAILLTKQYADTNAHTIPSAIWTDDIRGNQRYDAELPKQLKDGNPAIAHVAILGGVAFKYTTGFTEDPDQAAEATRTLLDATDIVTTSGSGTGTPPSVAKIAAMKQAAGDKPLAIASGVSLANLEEYRTVADQILVASSVETAPYSGVFDKAKLKDFIEQAHED